MNRSWIIGLCKVALVVTIVLAGFGNAVLYLWNAAMPGIFGYPVISYWQAVSLLCLAWTLFGSWRALPGLDWHAGSARAAASGRCVQARDAAVGRAASDARAGTN